MKCFIGLGSSEGDRKANLESAARALRGISPELRLSGIYETPALLPPNAPLTWNKPYLNAVAEMEWSSGPRELLAFLKDLESQLGRVAAPRWAPRIVDLDLLVFGDAVISEDGLLIPHPGIFERSFVLDPLSELASGLEISAGRKPAAVEARRLVTHTPAVMGILNLTPDSFSDGGENADLDVLETKLLRMDELGIQFADFGAESTRPGASYITPEEEWKRLEPALRLFQNLFRARLLRPKLSIDTRRSEVAERALELGADCINDVSGLSDPEMLEVLHATHCDYVLMHSLSVPADSRMILGEEVDPVKEIRNWLMNKLELLRNHQVDLDRVIFDPGVGFGKSAKHSLELIQRLGEFSDLPIRIMVGHSRKSFMKTWGLSTVQQKDAATLALSLELARKGVNILRVHEFETHAAGFRARGEVL